MPFSVETKRIETHCCITLRVRYWRETGNKIHDVQISISEEVLATEESFYVWMQAITTIINELRAKLAISDYYQVEYALTELVSKKYGLKPPHPYGVYRPSAVDTYRQKASSEFEGVTGLDPSLWEGTNGLT